MTAKPEILIIDDEKNTREGLEKALKFDYSVTLAEDAFKGLDLIRDNTYDMVLTDLRMPGLDGMALLREISHLSNPPMVIMLTAYGSVEVAVEAMKNGAYDYLTKPVNLDNLEMLIQRGLNERRLTLENRRLREKLGENDDGLRMIGESEVMAQVFADIRQMAPAKTTVLITGESGTGKELVAESLHRLSPRKDKPFITLHCAALNANLLESELFGHEKGAFTGADKRKSGRLELAEGGTLFLDEIGEIDHSTQVKLLRFLENKTFERVGGNETIKVNTRIVCATNRDLKKEVAEGNFREDLFYRLSILKIELPPLRERRKDIQILLNHYLKHFAVENGKKITQITDEAQKLLEAYRWPGNVRELRNIVERMVVMCPGTTLSIADIPSDLRQSLINHEEKPSEHEDFNMVSNEQHLIEQALKKCNNNITHAAKELGISRRTLHRKLHAFGIRRD